MNSTANPSPGAGARDLARLAAAQGGLITRAQLVRLGASESQIVMMVESGDLLEVDDGRVLRHPAHDPEFDEADRAVWFVADPSSFPEERLSSEGTPRLVLTGPGALAIRHHGPSGGPVIFACDALPEHRSPAHDFVVRPILSGEWEWVRGVPLARRTFAIADMVLAEDDEDSVRSALIDALAANDFAAQRFLEVIAPASRSWGLDPSDATAILRRLLPHKVVMHYATGTTTTIYLHRNQIKVESETPLGPNIGATS